MADLRQLPGPLAAAWVTVLAAFLVLSALADAGRYLPFDKRAIIFLWSHHHFFWQSNRFWIYMGNTGRVPFLLEVVAAGCIVLAVQRRRVEAIVLAGTVPMWLAILPVRAAIDRPLDRTGLPTYIPYPTPDSYPSGHAFGEMLVYGMILLLAGRMLTSVRAAWILRAICAWILVFGALERVVDAAHWPSDVIGAELLALLYVIPAGWLALRVPPNERAPSPAVTETRDALPARPR